MEFHNLVTLVFHSAAELVVVDMRKNSQKMETLSEDVTLGVPLVGAMAGQAFC